MPLTQRKFLFDHLPKTGGTAFRNVLEQVLGRENVTAHIEGRSEVWAIQRYAHVPLISGHFLSFIPGKDTWFGRTRLTLLRHPIDRAVSEYFYWRHHAGAGGSVADRLGEWAQRYDIADFFTARQESEETAAVNFVAKHFASRISRNIGDRQRTLQLAMKSLEGYDFIGIYEHLRDSVDMFCWQFRFPPVDDIPRVNVTTTRLAVSDLDRRTHDQLVAMNDLDMQIYEFGLGVFETKKRKMFRDLVLSCSRGKMREPDEPDRAVSLAQPPAGRAPASRLGQATVALTQRKNESFGTKEVEIVAAQVIGAQSGTNEVAPGEPVALWISISAHADIPNLTVGFDVSDTFGEVVFGTNTYLRGAVKSVRAGYDYDIVFRFDANLNRGRYSVGAMLHTGATHTERCFHWRDFVTEFDVVQLGEPDFIGYCRFVPEIEWHEVEVAGFARPSEFESA